MLPSRPVGSQIGRVRSPVGRRRLETSKPSRPSICTISARLSASVDHRPRGARRRSRCLLPADRKDAAPPEWQRDVSVKLVPSPGCCAATRRHARASSRLMPARGRFPGALHAVAGLLEGAEDAFQISGGMPAPVSYTD